MTVKPNSQLPKGKKTKEVPHSTFTQSRSDEYHSKTVAKPKARVIPNGPNIIGRMNPSNTPQDPKPGVTACWPQS